MAQAVDDVKDVPDDQGGEAQGGFVQQQHLGACHQGAADRQHLLLAARQGVGLLASAVLENREEAVDLPEVFLDQRPLGLPVLALEAVGADQEVFFHRQALQDHAAFGGLDHAQFRDLIRIQAHQVFFSRQGDGAGFGLHQAGDGLEQGGFSRAVGTEDGDDAALFDRQVYITERLDRAVADRQVFDVKHGGHHSTSPTIASLSSCASAVPR